MTSYDWRRFWQPTTRGGFEVVDVRETQEGLLAASIWDAKRDGYMPLYLFPDGRYGQEGGSPRDLLPVEQPAEQPEDTNGNFKCPLCGGSQVGRDTAAAPDGGVLVLDTVTCHGGGCKCPTISASTGS